MEDFRESFPILEDVSGAGLAITRVFEGSAVSGVLNAVPAIIAKNAAGQLVFLSLDGQGRLPVTSEGTGIPVRARGELSDGNATSGMALVSGAEISLTANRTYSEISFVVSCTRETHAQLVFEDNGDDRIMTDVILGPGQYTFESDMPQDRITAGAVGSQKLKIVARNLGRASAIRASIGAIEI
mgnify:CR=1 FL=1